METASLDSLMFDRSKSRRELDDILSKISGQLDS